MDHHRKRRGLDHGRPGKPGVRQDGTAEDDKDTADLTAWARLLGLHDQEGFRNAEPDTLRYRLWHILARLVRHARKKILKIGPDWPRRQAFITCRERLCALPAPG